jgi:hypothetical protein
MLIGDLITQLQTIQSERGNYNVFVGIDFPMRDEDVIAVDEKLATLDEYDIGLVIDTMFKNVYLINSDFEG